MLARVLHVEEG